MKELRKKIIIKNKHGLHARPAALFVQIANKYVSSVQVANSEQTVNGKSIMGIMMLAANCGSEVEIIVSGVDADKALVELEELLLVDDDTQLNNPRWIISKDEGKKSG